MLAAQGMLVALIGQDVKDCLLVNACCIVAISVQMGRLRAGMNLKVTT
jgi:hypothetical protein